MNLQPFSTFLDEAASQKYIVVAFSVISPTQKHMAAKQEITLTDSQNQKLMSVGKKEKMEGMDIISVKREDYPKLGFALKDISIQTRTSGYTTLAFIAK